MLVIVVTLSVSSILNPSKILQLVPGTIYPTLYPSVVVTILSAFDPVLNLNEKLFVDINLYFPLEKVIVHVL